MIPAALTALHFPRPFRRVSAWALAVVCLASSGAGRSGRAAVVPVNVRTAPGQFDIAAQDASVAHAVSSLADETWRHLSALLDLPAAFSSPVFVRVVAAGSNGGSHDAMAEAGGIVSVWIEAGAVSQPAVVRKALTRGLLLRLGVAGRGAEAMRTVPHWLEAGCALWVDTRISPAWLDAVRHETRDVTPPPIGSLLNDAPALRVRRGEAAALWLITFLQGENSSQREWSGFLQRVLRGVPADEALAAAYPGRFATIRERELWWQTGWHHVRQMRAFPTMESEDSAVALERLARFVFAPGGRDEVVSLRTLLAHARDGIVAGEFERRAAELGQIAPALHPFFRNAGLSLLEVYLQARKVSDARREALADAFDADWRDALELAAAAKSILDALEQDHR